MPLYDRACTAEECGWRALDIWEHVSMPLVVCPDCGAPTARAWLTKAANVIGDEIDLVQTNGLRHPRRFRSRLEHQRWLKENGYRVKDTHVGDQGSDKSKYTESVAIMDPQTMANAIFLVTHRAMLDAAEPPDKPLNIRWYKSDGSGYEDEA